MRYSLLALHPAPGSRPRRRSAVAPAAAGRQREARRLRLRRRPVGRRPRRRRRPPADRRRRAGELPRLLARRRARSPSPATTRATSTSTSSRPPAASRAGSPTTPTRTCRSAGRRTASRSSSARPRTSYARFLRLFTVPVGGGQPAELPLPQAEDGSLSPDGKRIAYVPLSNKPQFPGAFRPVRNYRGGTASPVWIADLADSAITKVPRTDSNDFNPMWVGDRVYFLSDRDGPTTLFAYDPASKEVKRRPRPGRRPTSSRRPPAPTRSSTTGSARCTCST